MIKRTLSQVKGSLCSFLKKGARLASNTVKKHKRQIKLSSECFYKKRKDLNVNELLSLDLSPFLHFKK